MTNSVFTPSAIRSQGVWATAWMRLKRDRVGMASLWVVLVFVLMVIASAVGLIATDWSREVAVPYANPSFLGPTPPETAKIDQPTGPMLELGDVDPLAPKQAQVEVLAKKYAVEAPKRLDMLPFGADRQGRDVVAKAIKGAQMSIQVGVLAALVATLIGTVLGAIAGYFGGRVGDMLEWLYNVFTAVPGILLIFAFAAVLGRGVGTVVLILGLTGWTGIYRLVRAEYMKHRQREYVRAATAIGASHARRMFVHILPNVSHVVLVQLSLHVVFFIKAEVILSFLGLGVPVDSISWGTMLNEAQAELILGKWWQLAAATAFMATFVTAFSMFTDALRDALDPKLR
ncbi:MAG TPA: ABC transporter permease [Burkholderiaceae bacterium]|nr:ABC transporter permease [Burkholderiaceae bacterium]